MRTRFDVEIPTTLSEVCRTERMALVVYDTHARIRDQLSTSKFKNWLVSKLRRQLLFSCPRVIDHQRQRRMRLWS